MTDKQRVERRGGRRKGAGRKPNYLKKLGLKPVTAASLLATVDEEKLVVALLHDKSADVRLRAWTTLREQAYGKPRQTVGLSGGVGVAHFDGGEPKTDAELDARLREITEELGLVPKTIAAPKELPAGSAAQKIIDGLQALVSPAPKAPENRATVPASAFPAPEPYHSVTASFPTPEGKGVTVYCDSHGPFQQKQPRQNCPTCQMNWDADNKKDAERLGNLLPGEPAWSRRR
jgi:hypothetical protein